MADFQSSLSAEELESKWIGSIVYNAPQGLSESQKAMARENIGAVAAGTTLTLLGHYSTVEELQTVVQEPSVGDCYSIGITTPYTLYIFDGTTSAWLDYGLVVGSSYASRAIENISIAPVDWVYDASVYEGYPYIAHIAIAEITANDFPIVVFSPEDAASMIFCPVAFSFDGRVDILASARPSRQTVISTINYIVEETT